MAEERNLRRRYQVYWSSDDPDRRLRGFLFKLGYEGGLSLLATILIVILGALAAPFVFGATLDPLRHLFTSGVVIFGALLNVTFCNLITDLRESEEPTFQSELPIGARDDESARK